MRRARAGYALLGESWSISWAIVVRALGRGVLGLLAYGVRVRLQFPVIVNWCRDACFHCGFPDFPSASCAGAIMFVNISLVLSPMIRGMASPHFPVAFVFPACQIRRRA